jgi:hypothetical protein
MQEVIFITLMRFIQQYFSQIQTKNNHLCITQIGQTYPPFFLEIFKKILNNSLLNTTPFL